MPLAYCQIQPWSPNTFVQPLLREQARISYHRARAADRIPLDMSTNTTTPETSTRYLQKLSQANRQDPKSFAQIKAKVKHNAQEIFQIETSPLKSVRHSSILPRLNYIANKYLVRTTR